MCVRQNLEKAGKKKKQHKVFILFLEAKRFNSAEPITSPNAVGSITPHSNLRLPPGQGGKTIERTAPDSP